MQLLNLHAARVRIVELDLLFATAKQDCLLQLLRQLVKRCFDVEFVMSREALDHLEVVGRFTIPAAYGAACQGQVGINDHPIRIKKLFHAKPVATGAGTAGVVE